MGKEYTITAVQRRNEWNSKFGPMQDYAITLEGDSQGWIKLTQKPETTPPTKGSIIFGTILHEETRNGNPYRKFKRENPNYQQNNTGSGAGSSVNEQKLDYIVQMLEELTDRRPPMGSEPSEQPPIDAYDDPLRDLGV